MSCSFSACGSVQAVVAALGATKRSAAVGGCDAVVSPGCVPEKAWREVVMGAGRPGNVGSAELTCSLWAGGHGLCCGEGATAGGARYGVVTAAECPCSGRRARDAVGGCAAD